MSCRSCFRLAVFATAILAAAGPAFAQIELSGAYASRLYEDYIERGPGEFLGNFTGMPLTDEGRSKALLYTSNQPSMYERQCLAQGVGVFQYRPRGVQIVKELDASGLSVLAWIITGDNLRGELRIWMDGRPRPSPNARHVEGGFTTGRWEGDTLVAETTHLKAAWIRRGVGLPSSDQTTMTTMITRHDHLLTITTIQKDPFYLSEPHVVSRVFEYDPRGDQTRDGVCVTGNELPGLEDTGQVPHYLPGENPEEDYMVRTFNVPKDAAMGHAYTLYPEYRKTIRSSYVPPAECGVRAPGYCCGWIERQGLPGGAPNLTCNDGGFGRIGPRGSRAAEGATR